MTMAAIRPFVFTQRQGAETSARRARPAEMSASGRGAVASPASTASTASSSASPSASGITTRSGLGSSLPFVTSSMTAPLWLTSAGRGGMRRAPLQQVGCRDRAGQVEIGCAGLLGGPGDQIGGHVRADGVVAVEEQLASDLVTGGHRGQVVGEDRERLEERLDRRVAGDRGVDVDR